MINNWREIRIPLIRLIPFLETDPFVIKKYKNEWTAKCILFKYVSTVQCPLWYKGGGGNSSILINLHDTEEEKYEPENEKYRFYSFLSAQWA